MVRGVDRGEAKTCSEISERKKVTEVATNPEPLVEQALTSAPNAKDFAEVGALARGVP